MNAHAARTVLSGLEIKMAHVDGGGVSCVLCRQQFVNLTYMQARMRHGFGEYGNRGICIAQYFVRNHVRYYQQQRDNHHLRIAVAHARQLWGHRDDLDWLEEAEAQAAEPADLFDLLD